MLDITKEISEYQKNGLESIQNLLQNEKQEIENKLYVLEVLEKLNSMQEAIQQGLFDNCENYLIKLFLDRDYDIGTVIRFELYNKEHFTLNKSSKNTLKIVQKLHDLFDGFNVQANPLDISQLNSFLKLDISLVDNLKNIMLTQDLKAALNHALLENQLPDVITSPYKRKI